MNPTANTDDKSLVEKFLEENVLFLGPDPEIMNSHKIAPESPSETEALARFSDPEAINLVRHKLQTACNESFDTLAESLKYRHQLKWRYFAYERI